MTTRGDSARLKTRMFSAKKRPVTAAVTSPERKGEGAILNPTDDPVAFFAKNKQGPVKFVYLNQVQFEVKR